MGSETKFSTDFVPKSIIYRETGFREAINAKFSINPTKNPQIQMFLVVDFFTL